MGRPLSFPPPSAGNATPEAALESNLWTMGRGDYDHFLAGLAPELQKEIETERGQQGLSGAQLLRAMAKDSFEVAELNLNTRTPHPDGRVSFELTPRDWSAEDAATHPKNLITFTNVGNEWKVTKTWHPQP